MVMKPVIKRSACVSVAVALSVLFGFGGALSAQALESSGSKDAPQSGGLSGSAGQGNGSVLPDQDVETGEAITKDEADGLWPGGEQAVQPNQLEPVVQVEFSSLEGLPGSTIAVSGECSVGGVPATGMGFDLRKIPVDSGLDVYWFGTELSYDGGGLEFSAEFKISKYATAGEYELSWQCGSGHMLWGWSEEPMAFTVLPRDGESPNDNYRVAEISLAKTQARPGETIQITGRCKLKDGPRAEKFWAYLAEDSPRDYSWSYSKSTLTYDSGDDRFSLEFKVSADTPPGNYRLRWSCGIVDDTFATDGVGIPFKVLRPSSSSPNNGSDGQGGSTHRPPVSENTIPKVLAKTGLSANGLVLSGAAIGAGLLVLVAARRHEPGSRIRSS